MKIRYLTLLIFLSWAIAGELKSGNEFVKEMASIQGLKLIDCPEPFIKDSDAGFSCYSYPNRGIADFRRSWNENASRTAEKHGYSYAIIDNWETSKDLGEVLTYRLNADPHLISAYKVPGFSLTMYASQSGYKVKPITALPSSTSTNNIPQNSGVNTTTLSQQNQGFDLEVIRYLCQPSLDGNARVFGTVKNTSARNLKLLEFTVEFFDGSSFVGQESNFVKADDLAPGSETTFELSVKVGNYTRCALSFEDDKGKLVVKLP